MKMIVNGYLMMMVVVVVQWWEGAYRCKRCWKYLEKYGGDYVQIRRLEGVHKVSGGRVRGFGGVDLVGGMGRMRMRMDGGDGRDCVRRKKSKHKSGI